MKNYCLCFYIFVKSVKKTKLFIGDNRITSCKYEKNNLPVYINIIRELAGYKSIYNNLEIYREKEKEFTQKINKYRKHQSKRFNYK